MSVKTITLVFENSECVTLKSDMFEGFFLSCTDITVNGWHGSIQKKLWTNDVGFILKENIPVVKDPSARDGIVGDWLEDSSLYGRLKYGDITQIYINYDNGKREVYYIDDYDDGDELVGPNKNQVWKENNGKLHVMIKAGKD